MNYSPLDQVASLRIGEVEYVSPDEIRVLLDQDSPTSIASNAGVPRPFPRINSYVLVTTESGYVVTQVEWIAVEKSSRSLGKNEHNLGMVDLPHSVRKMRTNPLGILKKGRDGFTIERGVYAFPSVGEPVLIPTDEQLKAIVESSENRRVKIGVSPMAANADVCIDPDKLFGRHLAVLGNTGSGKSCSVAGLIQWSIGAVKADIEKRKQKTEPNIRFIILDPNGEYSKVFPEESQVFKVGDGVNPLQVPLWFWNSSEWTSFSQASPGAQAPLLKQALRAMRNDVYDLSDFKENIIKNRLGTILKTARHECNSGSPWGSFPKPKSFFEKVCKWLESAENYKGDLDANDDRLDELINNLTSYKDKRSGKHPTYEASSKEVEKMISVISSTFSDFGGLENMLLPKHEDVPTKYSGEAFVELLEALAQDSGTDIYIHTLISRIRTILADSRIKKVVGDHVPISLAGWLMKYISGNGNDRDNLVTIIDMSLIPTEVVHLVTAVVARIVFEALQRYRQHYDKPLPTVLVMEEAHTFVKRYKEDSEIKNTATVCCEAFEKISREGRKYGLGLVLSSQRPSELSPTVLSQCNSFLLHRISNDQDQDLVRRLLPDNLRGLMRELPSLPSQHAILLGWASELPILVRMNDLQKDERPHSDDPDFWDVWTRALERQVDWEEIANEWQGIIEEDNTQDDDLVADDPEESDSDSNATTNKDDDIPF